jgi:DNA-binding PadR family transcriptional regulator
MVDMTAVDTRDPDELLPLTPASFHILLVLAEGPTHGYAIMLEVDRMTGGKTHLGPGTLYRTIQKLLDDELIVALDGSPAGSDERRQRYRLTRFGLVVARAEVARLAVLLRIAQRRGLTTGAARTPRGATP